MRNLLKKLPTTALTFFLGVLVATLVTQVMAHGGNTNLIHGCVKNSNGSVKIVGVNDTAATEKQLLIGVRVVSSQHILFVQTVILQTKYSQGLI